eukprot:2324124-Pyramimonas_sp.AAC.1
MSFKPPFEQGSTSLWQESAEIGGSIQGCRGQFKGARCAPCGGCVGKRSARIIHQLANPLLKQTVHSRRGWFGLACGYFGVGAVSDNAWLPLKGGRALAATPFTLALASSQRRLPIVIYYCGLPPSQTIERPLSLVSVASRY